MTPSTLRATTEKQYEPAAARWRAVQSRDRGADGLFVYAVRSTGVYCRPSCASRKPQANQVVFFPLPEAAEQQGFRECKRCKPRTVNLRDPRTKAVAQACREIDSRVRDGNEAPVTLSALSAPLGHEPASTGARISQRDGNHAAPICRRATDAAAEISIEKRRRRDNGTVRRRFRIEQQAL